jgi:gluconolactonase
VDLATGRVEVLYRECGGVPLCGPNDLVFDGHGGFWFTDLGKVRARSMDRGAVYYARTDGSGIREAIFPIMTPNGVGLSPDGRHALRRGNGDEPAPGL